MMLIFDLLLIALIAITAWFALATPNLIRAAIIFISFGLLVALAWVRLGAPDVALAEAAVGTGLTGALVISTVYILRRPRVSPAVREAQQEQKDDEHV
jgi:uncharacterized MnhB-related membrane protein